MHQNTHFETKKLKYIFFVFSLLSQNFRAQLSILAHILYRFRSCIFGFAKFLAFL